MGPVLVQDFVITKLVISSCVTTSGSAFLCIVKTSISFTVVGRMGI